MHKLTFIFFTFALAGCSSIASSDPPIPQYANVPAMFTREPAPFNPALHASSMHDVEAPNISFSGAPPPDAPTALNKRSRESSVVSNGAEDAGVTLSGGGPYESLFAILSAYLPSQLTLTYPSGGSATGSEYLYAPSLRATNGACLEIGIHYSSTRSTSTQASLTVYSWCGTPHYVYTTAINSTFASKYIRSSTYGPGVAVEVYTTTTPITSKNTWYAVIYNYTRGAYDTLASVQGKTSTMGGVDWFTTYYQPGQCPKSLPPIFSYSAQMYNTLTRTFQPVRPTMASSTTSIINGKTYDCFKTTTSGSASYVFDLLSANDAWKVVSTGH